MAFKRRIKYLAVEHPHVSYHNLSYLEVAKLTAQRYGRRNPVYYVGLNLKTVVTFDNNIIIDFIFYEFLSNTYRRTFVEMHYPWCDLIFKDMFFGPALRQGKLLKPCPHPPDDYKLVNMTVPPAAIPSSFPFRKGRILANLTTAKPKHWVACGHIDMEIKEIRVKAGTKIQFSGV
ncbi:uncharacterized protein LOC101738215 isoform X1 [Bombyx mori]|uniref:uncharacterized protein LOC101738215 isoform X1 n=1 Tax=Bombyx mori TaxID=7091 RepID=UPI002ED23FC9